jgi:DNA-binding response OmpR family regulator
MWLRRTRVLHVEDDPAFQALVRAVLAKEEGFVVETAGDALGALGLAAERTPDLVILDLELPGADGLETLRALRALHGMDRVPVLFLTSSTDLMRAVEMVAAGAVTVLQKSSRPHALAAAVHRALGRGAPPPSFTAGGDGAH